MAQWMISPYWFTYLEKFASQFTHPSKSRRPFSFGLVEVTPPIGRQRARKALLGHLSAVHCRGVMLPSSAPAASAVFPHRALTFVEASRISVAKLGASLSNLACNWIRVAMVHTRHFVVDIKGDRAYFWSDNWVEGIGLLHQFATRQMEVEQIYSRLKDYTNGRWD
ncbi:hypothetical protein Syun_018533 [Stephania yunnanensis]|uniref:Uncharacterized protein n=1 Tax=Stephania yunnanensis TaxID=152371 RepID=A0AAP0IUR7_9MAGN